MRRRLFPGLLLAAALVAVWAAAGFAAVRLGREVVRAVASAAVPASPDLARSPGNVDEAGRTASEAEAVRRAASVAFRAVTDDDAAPSPERDDLAALYGDYRPYFVRGDLDGDGVLDFVQAFVKRRSDGALFDVLVFFGKPGGGFRPPVFAARDVALAEGDIALDRSILVLTPDLTAETTRRLRWDAGEGRFVDVDERGPNPPGDEGPEPDPDHRPRARV